MGGGITKEIKTVAICLGLLPFLPQVPWTKRETPPVEPLCELWMTTSTGSHTLIILCGDRFCHTEYRLTCSNRTLTFVDSSLQVATQIASLAHCGLAKVTTYHCATYYNEKIMNSNHLLSVGYYCIVILLPVNDVPVDLWLCCGFLYIFRNTVD